MDTEDDACAVKEYEVRSELEHQVFSGRILHVLDVKEILNPDRADYFDHDIKELVKPQDTHAGFAG